MPQIQKRQPRLKDSCDRCSNSKVRCTKDKPACSRCSSKGLNCIYSYSRRAGRRHTTSNPALPAIIDRSITSSPDSMSSTPSASSSLSPERTYSMDSSDSSDNFDMWSYTAPTSYPMEQLPADYTWSAAGLQQDILAQPIASLPPHHLPMDPSFVAPLQAVNVNVLEAAATHFTPFDPVSLPSEPEFQESNPMHRSSSSTSSSTSTSTSVDSTQVDALHDELSNLTTFAESMEKKFDAVVRQRVQYRDVYTEFGIPMDELELPNASEAALSDETYMEAQSDRAAGHVPTPDLSEISFYYSLAELKRRLKWVREDVGNLIVPVMQ